MDDSPQRFAYHCLPLVVANEVGFDLPLSEPVESTWDGGMSLDALRVSGPAVSNFGQGIVTFHVDAIFRTPPGVQLLVMGPPNEPKDGVQPLVGVVESSWATATFTMNWMHTRPGTIRWEAGETFCKVIPSVVLGLPAGAHCDVREITENEALQARYAAFSQKRQGWDGKSRDLDYKRGRSADGTPAMAGEHHRSVRP